GSGSDAGVDDDGAGAVGVGGVGERPGGVTGDREDGPAAIGVGGFEDDAAVVREAALARQEAAADRVVVPDPQGVARRHAPYEDVVATLEDERVRTGGWGRGDQIEHGAGQDE